MLNAGVSANAVFGLAVALGSGLLIGLDRERRKGTGSGRHAAGIRSFALAAFGGGLAEMLDIEGLVVVCGVLVAALASLAYWRGRTQADPGLTTELALFITYLVGVVAVKQPAIGAGAAAVVAVLLALREPLHRFVTQTMTQEELYDALLLAALALVLLPLMPNEPIAWLGGMVPRLLLYSIVLLLLMQFVGHVGLRLLGQRAGLALAGLLSGFVSSTVTIATLGARQKRDASAASACLVGAVLSTASTWAAMLLLVATLAPTASVVLAPMAVAGIGGALITAWPAWRAIRVDAEPVKEHTPEPSPLSLRAALLLAMLLSIVSAGVGWAYSTLGSSGLLVGIAVSALVDAHSSVGALVNLYKNGAISADLIRQGVLIAVAANSLSRSIIAWVAGGFAFAWRMGLSLTLSTLAATGVFLLWP